MLLSQVELDNTPYSELVRRKVVQSHGVQLRFKIFNQLTSSHPCIVLQLVRVETYHSTEDDAAIQKHLRWRRFN